jgi:hypothetical protein
MGDTAVMTVKQGVTLLVIDVASCLLLVRLRVTTEGTAEVEYVTRLTLVVA